jgi:hypothetical protein
MHAPIDEAEEHALGELTHAYDELVAAQSALTSRVQAAAKLKQIQDDALNGLGVQQTFERVRQQAIAVGAGVGTALDQMERLDPSALLKGTRMAEILRAALAPAPTVADTTAAP